MSNRFRSSGYAIGASGEISRPFSEVIEVQAASVLPRIGGYGSARSVAFKHREILQYDLAHTEVIGAPCDGQDGKQSHSTRVRSTIEGLNIMGMVTADRVVATVFAHCKKVSSLQLIGTYFDNLRIAGIPVEVDLAVDLFDRHDTYKSLKEAYKTDDPDVHKLLDQPALRAAPEDVLRDLDLPELGSELPSSNGIATVSLVREIVVPKSAGLRHWGHVIQVSGFGIIRLAEVEIGNGARTVSMVQVHLHCPMKGRIQTCEVSGVCEGGN